ncbi:MAG: HAD family hydrolase [Alteromonadaceae bacterium]|nr:HAD family hydrolase [Alteromonadaceae bacterium]
MAEYTQDIAFVIFDFDGVLIDSEVLSMKVWASLLQEHDVHIDQQYFFEHFLGRSFEHVQSVIFKDFNLVVDSAMANRFAGELKTIFEQQLSPTDGIIEVLSTLTVPYCLATSSSRERTRIAMSTTGLNRYFSEAQIFTAADVARGKPAPDLFLHAAQQNGIPPSHCLVIEDSSPGLEAAKAAKMHCLHYVGGAHMAQTAGKRENALAHWRAFDARYPYLID